MAVAATTLGWLMPDTVSALAAAVLMAAAALAWGAPADPVAMPQPDPEDRAARAERLRAVRHDLRGALSPILLLSDQLAASDDERVRRAAATIAEAVERAAETLRRVEP